MIIGVALLIVGIGLGVTGGAVVFDSPGLGILNFFVSFVCNAMGIAMILGVS